MFSFILTFLAGVIFGYIFFKLKIPGGIMVGAIIGSMFLNIFFSTAFMPENAKFFAQTTAGAYIGSTISKEDIRQLKYIFWPIVIILVGLLILNIFVGIIISIISPMDLVTSLMGCVPGGMTDVPIIVADMGADVPKVVVMQFSRLVAGIGVFPTLIGIVDSKLNKNQKQVESQENTDDITLYMLEQDTKTKENFIKTVISAVVGGILGKIIGMPGGVLLFSLIFVMLLKLYSAKTYMPMWLKHIAQVLAGTYIGSSMDFTDILELKQVIIPIGILLFAYFLNSCVTGFILYKKFGFSLKEGILAANPAGASDMALISEDLGVRSPRLTLIHIIRLLAVIIIFPQIILLIITILNNIVI